MPPPSEFLLTFIPLFVAIDPVGVLPFLLPILRQAEPSLGHRILHYALITATAIGIGFMAIGQFVFVALGITTSDFLVAGGLLLLVLSVKDIATGKMLEPAAAEQAGAGIVPIGVPMVAGPATLTTLLLLVSQYSVLMVLFSFLVNMAIAWVVFHQAERVTKLLGHGGQLAVTKIASLLLAAIAVRMVRQGVTGILSF